MPAVAVSDVDRVSRCRRTRQHSSDNPRVFRGGGQVAESYGALVTFPTGATQPGQIRLENLLAEGVKLGSGHEAVEPSTGDEVCHVRSHRPEADEGPVDDRRRTGRAAKQVPRPVVVVA